MNSNLRITQLFVDALVQAGVRHACISPGSRSTPLTLAFYNHPGIVQHLLLDERSAAFFALGLAMTSGKPAALICTSGSAAANYFPAIVEARMSHIPLLVLTADRPHELRGSGANQTIDQVKLYGDMVLMSVDMPAPETELSPLVERHIHTLAARALAASTGFEKGPVHLNFPFRKPLEPASPADIPSATLSSRLPLTSISRGRISPTTDQVVQVASAVRDHPHGLIVCGPLTLPVPGFAAAVHSLSKASGYPILADPLSGLRYSSVENPSQLVCAYDALLSARPASCPAPGLVLRFGAVPTSTALGTFLERSNVEQILISENGQWADDTHRVNRLIQVDEALFASQVAAALADGLLDDSGDRQEFAQTWGSLEQTAWGVLNEQIAQSPLFDAVFVRVLQDLLPADARIFVGNSLAVRHFDRFAAPVRTAWQVWGTRGASGIDGNLSVALGIAAADPQHPVVALLGDIALLHDLNALHIPNRLGLNRVTILVNNNRGGGIFRRLPIQAIDPPFTEAFLTPHELTFEHAARMFGLEYTQASTLDELKLVLVRRFGDSNTNPALIEIPTDSASDIERNSLILQALRKRLGD